MRVRKFISGFIAVVLAMASLAVVVSAAPQEIPVSVTLREATKNTLIASATKTTSDTHYDEFSWTGGTTNSVTVWVKADSGRIIGIKTKIEKNAGYTIIWYRNGESIPKGSTASMYAEQFNIATKTLIGTARFT